mmetsp:Transcript_25878/g.77511  ORF Transcript_25878/g.77511 Transcript_25878/m.77511 type:complete len:421 (-) Transcript_25878:522-1784(-)
MHKLNTDTSSSTVIDQPPRPPPPSRSTPLLAGAALVRANQGTVGRRRRPRPNAKGAVRHEPPRGVPQAHDYPDAGTPRAEAEGLWPFRSRVHRDACTDRQRDLRGAAHRCPHDCQPRPRFKRSEGVAARLAALACQARAPVDAVEVEVGDGAQGRRDEEGETGALHKGGGLADGREHLAQHEAGDGKQHHEKRRILDRALALRAVEALQHLILESGPNHPVERVEPTAPVVHVHSLDGGVDLLAVGGAGAASLPHIKGVESLLEQNPLEDGARAPKRGRDLSEKVDGPNRWRHHKQRVDRRPRHRHVDDDHPPDCEQVYPEKDQSEHDERGGGALQRQKDHGTVRVHRLKNGQLVHAPEPGEVVLVPEDQQPLRQGDEACQVPDGLDLLRSIGLRDAGRVDEIVASPLHGEQEDGRGECD